ncbi:hypothetical protein JCGZ_13046 [Jatropha curcas]|uniref:Glycine-rich protein n=1 Tax=Jatropha curcas TaxID=180498 RepID=A0A067KL63_JATCU|nr:hypothetical protein JCGZ_13046 [Jatropha curcas]
MKSKSNYFYPNKDDSSFIWNTKKKKKKTGNQFPVTEFLQDNYRKVEEAVVGPGGGIGIGCGIGAGFGLVGAFGYGGWPWNHFKLVFGVGMGCGIGLGFGYGGGVGYGVSLDSLNSQMSNDRKSDSNKKGILFGI